MSSSDDIDPYEGGSSGSSYKPSDSSESEADHEEPRDVLVVADVHTGNFEGTSQQSCTEENVPQLMESPVHHQTSSFVVRNEETPQPNGGGLITNPGMATTAIRSRKRKRQPKNWRVNVLKEKHQTGQQYINSKGTFVAAKRIKTTKNWYNSCKFKCSRKISESERLEIFTSFYKLTHNEKHLFILNTTKRCSTVRPDKSKVTSKRKYSFSYFANLNNDQIQVCKNFYLGTLSISQKPVYNAHNGKDVANTPKPDLRGRNSSRRIPENVISAVKDHINSFPRVESHYCRSTTTREYLESSLYLRKMYELYLEKVTLQPESAEPVKYSMFRYIFNTEFNLSFHIRKTDRCDLCEHYDVAKKENIVTEDLKFKYEKHISDKKSMRAEREKDRNNKDVPVLCFDLQNVITLPRADINSFFYTRKLNLYNLTGHLSVSKTKYCAIWTECSSGRGGNEIASAFKKILDKIAEEHHFTKLITWSDSCVPQNRNSFISSAVLHFLKENPDVTEINMKYSTPGHSCIQEVDSAHSAIEKAILLSEIYSPIGLVKLLKKINTTHPFRVIQMLEDDFKDYSSVAKTMNFKQVPFTTVCSLRFTQNLSEVCFLPSFTNSLYRVCNLRLKDRPTRKQRATEVNIDLTPKPHRNPPVISNEKKNDIKSMLKFMPSQDQLYFKTLLKILNTVDLD